MIHKQQMGHRIEDILYGLCRALVRNYLNNVGSGKDIQPPTVFQGGVAFNEGIVRAFREELDNEVTVPSHHEVMGAIGAAMLVHEEIAQNKVETKFQGFSASEIKYHTSSFECKACPKLCEIGQLSVNGQVLTQWGGLCDLPERSQNQPPVDAERKVI